jgi:alcohol dehydrogenase class IV
VPLSTVLTGRFQTDIVRRVENVLKERQAYGATFYQIGEHSPIADIKNGIQVFRESGADVIISVGGGSPIDASKAMIYTIQRESGGEFYRQIAIPTTLSAAEYTVRLT